MRFLRSVIGMARRNRIGNGAVRKDCRMIFMKQILQKSKLQSFVHATGIKSDRILKATLVNLKTKNQVK
jgi:hypothetical protein